MSLHDDLVAAVTARRELARQATEGLWAIWRDLDHQGFYTVGDVAGVIPEGAVETQGECNPTAHVYVEPDAKFIAANSPSQILRDTEAHLKILKLHQRYVNAVERGRKTGLHHDDPEGAAQDRACLMVLDEAFRALAGIYPEVTEQ